MNGTHTHERGYFGVNLETFVLIVLLLLTLFVYASSNSRFAQQPNEEATGRLSLKQIPDSSVTRGPIRKRAAESHAKAPGAQL